MNILVAAMVFLPLVLNQSPEPIRVNTCSNGDPVCEVQPASFGICPDSCVVQPSGQPSLLTVYTRSVMQYLAEAEYVLVYLSDGTEIIYRQVYGSQPQVQTFGSFTDVWFLYPWPVGGEGVYWQLHFEKIASFKP